MSALRHERQSGAGGSLPDEELSLMTTDIAPRSGAFATEAPTPSGLRLAYERARIFIEPRRRQGLGLILLLAAFCNFYELQRNGFANLYYSAAIRSMLESWHNFFFVAFDPGGFVTVDKPPLGLLDSGGQRQALRLTAASASCCRGASGRDLRRRRSTSLVRRIFGSVAGLLAALFLAITPISVVTNRNNTIDSLLVLTVLLGAYCVGRAAERVSLRWLLLAAVAVGLGFNIKMLEAYLVVPGLRRRVPLRLVARLVDATSGICSSRAPRCWRLARLGPRGGPHPRRRPSLRRLQRHELRT